MVVGRKVPVQGDVELKINGPALVTIMLFSFPFHPAKVCKLKVPSNDDKKYW